jgi:hypothetical protein
MSGDDLLRNRFGIEPGAIAAFCRKWQICELSLFGSALRDDLAPPATSICWSFTKIRTAISVRGCEI